MKKISGNIIDVIDRRIYKGEITIENGKITTIENCDDVDNVYILPGLIDAHIHIESSMLIPSEFAKLAVVHGTTATVSDPHEIANVLGVAGIDYMINDGKQVPLKFNFGCPSCVPATGFETSGASLSAKDIEKLIQRDDLSYLSEMMNFPGVIYADGEVMNKIKAAQTVNKPIDGHAPTLTGDSLIKYANAGITTDHESSTAEEAIEKIKLGIKLLIREGSAAKNFEALNGILDKFPDDVMLCSDDLHPDDLLNGHINLLIKRALDKKLDLFNVLRAATYNPVKHYKLNSGLLQIGDAADMIIIDNPYKFNVLKTYIDGELVNDAGKVNIKYKNEHLITNFNAQKITAPDLELKAKSKSAQAIGIIVGDLYTKKIIVEPLIENGLVVSDIKNDVLKIVVINRYVPAKPVIGLVKNFGIKNGAVASSVAHDSHNIIAIGANDADLLSAINKLIESKGGLVVCENNQFIELPLPVAGLMSNQNGEIVAEKYQQINNEVKRLGSKLHAPLMSMSFLALLVIPEIKIGDKGLFDVIKFEFTELFI